MPEIDRRDFLRASIPTLLAAGSLEATSVPPAKPPPKIGDTLPAVKSEEVLRTPAEATGRLGDPRMRIPGHLNAVQFSPRGTTMVGAGGEEIRAWDPLTGKLKFRVSYPEGGGVDAGRLTSRDTFALLLRPNNGSNYEIRHYEFGTGKLVAISKPIDLGNTQQKAFSLDGTLLACVKQEGITLYDAMTGAEKWKDSLPAQAAGDLAFFADGSMLALAMSGEVKLYNVATGKVASTLKFDHVPKDGGKAQGNRGKDWLQNLVISPDGVWLAAAVGEESDAVCCWEVKTGKLMHIFKPEVRPVGFTPKGNELVTCRKGVATFWSLPNGKPVRSIDVPHDQELMLTSDGMILGSYDGDSAILIDANTGKHFAYSSDPPGLPSTLQFSDPKHIRGRLDGWGGWIEWDMTTGKSRTIRPPSVSGFQPVSLSANGEAALYRQDGDYGIRTTATGKIEASSSYANNDKYILSATLTPDGKRIVGWRPGELVLETVGVKAEKTIPRCGVSGTLSGIFIAHERPLAAVGLNNNESGSVQLFDLSTDKFLRQFSTEGDVGQVAFSADGDWIAVAHDIAGHGQWNSQSSTATVFEAASGKPSFQIPPSVNSREHIIAFSSNGRLLARYLTENESSDKTAYKIAIWEVLSGSIRKTLDVGGSVSALAFSPDARTLAASVAGGPVFLWDLYAEDRRKASTAATLERAWEDMRSPESSKAFVGMRLFFARAAQSIAFLKDKVSPVEIPNAEKVQQLIADLANREFRRREAASRDLVNLGDRIRGTLQAELKATIPPESRERIEKVLAAEEKPAPELLRLLRAIEVLEVLATSEAIGLLKHWATGAVGARFTQEAGAAVNRLTR